MNKDSNIFLRNSLMNKINNQISNINIKNLNKIKKNLFYLEKINEIINQEGGSFNTTYKITDNIYELINTIQNNKNSNIFKINIAKEIIKDHFLRLYNEYNNIYINLLVQPNKIINIDILKENLIDFDIIVKKLVENIDYILNLEFIEELKKKNDLLRENIGTIKNELLNSINQNSMIGDSARASLISSIPPPSGLNISTDDITVAVNKIVNTKNAFLQNLTKHKNLNKPY